MSLVSGHHRLPRAGLDPITDDHTALAIIALSIQRPLRPETIVVVLDHEHCGIGIVVVTGTAQPDDVIGVIECLAAAATYDGRAGGLIVASVRPPDARAYPAAAGPQDGEGADARLAERDLDRWLEMSDLAEQAGFELFEWYVIGADIERPRDRLGEPPRWP